MAVPDNSEGTSLLDSVVYCLQIRSICLFLALSRSFILTSQENETIRFTTGAVTRLLFQGLETHGHILLQPQAAGSSGQELCALWRATWTLQGNSTSV